MKPERFLTHDRAADAADHRPQQGSPLLLRRRAEGQPSEDLRLAPAELFSGQALGAHDALDGGSRQAATSGCGRDVAV